ncbi:hypothetical protein PGT21_027095 [Puccinia graminis f. sp. tritici]|uniref:CxC1-like cysteine cluster associated with KDZ transposases domain-containing protein n=1 Tax=Puccinia graminis f. sp. tritici TaxID=56615 RepID=A0A5B0QVP7_PUCGR|nr:hypothetical protein PGT21_027095 [Puccinia graminis f. sp. tritici]KAA1116995.1 hypothetical protein PGTUg99_033600 [Puccinia graminis f. sp. tritici]
MPPKPGRQKNLYKFHYGCQLFPTETRTQKKLWLACQLRTQAETRPTLRRNLNRRSQDDEAAEEPTPSHPVTGTDENDGLGFDEDPSLWEDTEEILNEEDEASRARLRSLHQEIIQQQRHRNWKDVMACMFPAYLHFKKLTANWTIANPFLNLSNEVCQCPDEVYKEREVDLIDLMGKTFLNSTVLFLKINNVHLPSGQSRSKFAFCPCTPDPVHLLASGYIASTPVLPQTAFSVRLLNFYDLLWNICNAHTTPFAKVLQRWNESLTTRLNVRNSTKPRELRRNLVAAIDVYRTLKSKERKLIQELTSTDQQDVLAQQSCPACFGVSIPDTNSTEPASESVDNHQVFICLDGNFQHRHHERASKNYIGIKNQTLFVPSEEIDISNSEIREAEIAKRVTKKAKDRCAEQHKAADDRRNASTWKGCDNTGLFGCCCRHDSVIAFCNIHKTVEGRGLPMSIIKRFLTSINPNIQVGVLYDIGCTLGKFFKACGLLTNHLPRMKFATAVFHSYVHDWPCQLQFNPRYNKGWGLTDGEGLERLWSYLSPLVSPLRYATRNHQISAINHRSLFHNTLGIENIVLTLKRKFIHAVTTKKESEGLVRKMLQDQNPHQPGQKYTVEFFWAQWKKQRDFEIDINQTNREKKAEQAQFYERGETLKTLAESFVDSLAITSPQLDPTQSLSLLHQIQELQRLQDEQAAKLGSLFVAECGAERDSEQEKLLGLLWSVKSALHKCAVKIQGEMQPLRDSKGRRERLGTVLKEKIFEALGRRKGMVTRILNTFCNRRTEYLKKYAPDQLGLPENEPITYDEFKTLRLDDPFWNDTYLCFSKDPWAVDPSVRTGIHAVLRLDRAQEELIQLKNELRRCVSWGIHFCKQLQHRIDQCVFNTADSKLDDALRDAFGVVSYEIRKITSNHLESVQNDHENILLNWQPVVEEIIAMGVVSRSYLPAEWFALVVFLRQNKQPPEVNVDLFLEETVLDAQDSDGESEKDDDLVNIGSRGVEHVPPEDD